MVLSDFPGPGGARRAQGGPQTDDLFRLRRMLPYRPVSAALAIAPTVSVVIPAMNEAANLPHVFASLPSWVDEIIVVDGHSASVTAGS